MFELKALSKKGIARAIEKADRYRLLNESMDPESICLDILAADPGNQRALIILILAMSDQFGQDGFHVQENDLRELLSRISDKYERVYYTGVVHERRAKATRKRHVGDSLAIDWFQKAMKSYEEAIEVHPVDNDDAILRWNTCARIMNHNQQLQQVETSQSEPYGD